MQQKGCPCYNLYLEKYIRKEHKTFYLKKDEAYNYVVPERFCYSELFYTYDLSFSKQPQVHEKLLPTFLVLFFFKIRGGGEQFLNWHFDGIR